MLKIIALLLMVWVSSTLQVCYLPNRHPCGDGDPEGVCPQIDSTRPAHCCPPGFVCVSNWLCQALADGHYARYGCSEQNAEPDCVSNTICGINNTIPGGVAVKGSVDGSVTVNNCGDGQWCCDGNGQGDCCKDSDAFSFNLPDPTAMTTITAVEATRSSSSSSATTSTALARSSTTDRSASSSSSPAAASSSRSSTSHTSSTTVSPSSYLSFSTQSHIESTSIIPATSSTSTTYEASSSPNKAVTIALSVSLPVSFFFFIIFGVCCFRRRRRRSREIPDTRPPSYVTNLGEGERSVGDEKIVDTDGNGSHVYFEGKRVDELDPASEVPPSPNTMQQEHEIEGSPVVSNYHSITAVVNSNTEEPGEDRNTAWSKLASYAPKEVYQPYRRPEPPVETTAENTSTQTTASSPLVDARGSVNYDRVISPESSVGGMAPIYEKATESVSGEDRGKVQVAHGDSSVADIEH